MAYNYEHEDFIEKKHNTHFEVVNAIAKSEKIKKSYSDMTSLELSIDALESRHYNIACSMHNIYTRSGATSEYRYLERKSYEIEKQLKSLKN